MSLSSYYGLKDNGIHDITKDEVTTGVSNYQFSKTNYLHTFLFLNLCTPFV